jgi:hypothetical protein
MQSDDELKRLARKRAEDKVGFYWHFAIYVVVNLAFVIIWWFTGGSSGAFSWFVVIMLLWGIGLVAHGGSVFLGSSLIDRMAEQEFRKLKGWK